MAVAAGSTGLQANGPATRCAMRAGLAQRPRSGRIGIGTELPAGEGRSACVVMELRRKFGRRDARIRRKINGRAAAEAIAAARKAIVVPVLMMRRGFSAVVIVLLRAGLAVSGVQVKRSMGVAACERERQQHDEAAQEQGSLHEIST